jgi:hypothetical protein
VKVGGEVGGGIEDGAVRSCRDLLTSDEFLGRINDCIEFLSNSE